MTKYKASFVDYEILIPIVIIILFFSALFLPRVYNASEVTQSKVTPIFLIDKYHKDGDCYTDANGLAYCDADEFVAVLGDRSKVRISKSNFNDIKAGQSYQLTENIGRLGWVIDRTIK